MLFTNLASLPTIDGRDLTSIFERLRVEVVVLQYTWKPSGHRRLWFNQYYVFDILSYLEGVLAEDDVVLLADSDCIFVRNPTSLFDMLRRDGVLLLKVDESLTDDDEINGLSRRQSIDVYEDLGELRPNAPATYFGGECYGLTVNVLRKLMVLARAIKPANDALAAAGSQYLSDEAHFFSFLMWKLGFSKANANTHVRRIWTAWKHNETRVEDLDLTLWHLPSEKTLGFKQVFDRLDTWPQFASESENRAWLAQKMGVGRRSLRNFLRHLASAVRRRLVSLYS